MPGFLDRAAPSIAAEYARYLDGDIYGKLIFKNLCRNTLNIADHDIHIPIGRYGDFAMASKPKADALVLQGTRHLDIEIKCSRVNIANRTRGDTNANWAFQGLTRTPKGDRKKYDIVIAIGVNTLGLEDPEYWKYMTKQLTARKAADTPFRSDIQPHDDGYLALCGFFIIPRSELASNYFRVTVGAIESNNYKAWFAWGHDKTRCRKLWRNAVNQCK